MPDRTHQAVSASQVAAMFNHGRFGTRWLLWQHFVRSSDWRSEPNDRMLAGKYFEGGILDWSAAVLGCEVRRHDQTLVRHPLGKPLCATKDADIDHPQFGPGVVEAKLILPEVWRARWSEETPDPEVVLQVQTQLAVQLGAKWAAIAVFVEGGTGLRIFKVARDAELIARIEAEAEAFMGSVRDLIEPAVEGVQAELDEIARLYPVQLDSKVINVDDERFDEACDAYLEHGELRRHHSKLEAAALTYIRAVAKDAQVVQSRYHQVYLRRSKSGAALAPIVKLQERL